MVRPSKLAKTRGLLQFFGVHLFKKVKNTKKLQKRGDFTIFDKPKRAKTRRVSQFFAKMRRQKLIDFKLGDFCPYGGLPGTPTCVGEP